MDGMMWARVEGAGGKLSASQSPAACLENITNEKEKEAGNKSREICIHKDGAYDLYL
jgi:hypothetical protein